MRTFPRCWLLCWSLRSTWSASTFHWGPSTTSFMTSTLVSSLSYVGDLFIHLLYTVEVRINLQEGVSLAKDICNGMSYIHTIESVTQRFELNPHHIVVSALLANCLCQVLSYVLLRLMMTWQQRSTYPTTGLHSWRAMSLTIHSGMLLKVGVSSCSLLCLLFVCTFL